MSDDRLALALRARATGGREAAQAAFLALARAGRLEGLWLKLQDTWHTKPMLSQSAFPRPDRLEVCEWWRLGQCVDRWGAPKPYLWRLGPPRKGPRGCVARWDMESMEFDTGMPANALAGLPGTRPVRYTFLPRKPGKRLHECEEGMATWIAARVLVVRLPEEGDPRD